MEDKIKDFTTKMGKGGAGMPGAPKGLGLGMKVLAAGMATVYGINESMYTGKLIEKYTVVASLRKMFMKILSIMDIIKRIYSYICS